MSLHRLVVVSMVVAMLIPATSRATHTNQHCFTGSRSADVIARGRFMKRPWAISYYRDKRERPCLVTDWFRYGSIYPFKVRSGHPRVGMLDLASTETPGDQPGAYVLVGYVAPRIDLVTFRLDGTTDEVRIVPGPSSGLRKDLIVHFANGGRFNRDRQAILRLHSANGDVIRRKPMRRGDFIPKATID